MKLRHVVWIALLLLCGPAWGAEPLKADVHQNAPTSVDGSTRALAGAAVILPGILLHGSGAFVMGDRETAYRLAAVEGVGLGVGLSAAAIVMFSGAAEQLITAAMGMSVVGIGLFSASFLADVYTVAAPEGGFGRPASELPMVEVTTGYQAVYNPVLQDSHFARLGGRLRLDPLEVAAQGWLSETSGRRIELDGQWRLMGNPYDKQRGDHSFLGLRLGYTHDGTVKNTGSNLGELELVSRLDLFHVGRLLRGSFAELSLGYAGGWLTYASVDERDYTSLLLARFAFGIYLGEGGEAWTFYDQRHDGFAGGLKLNGVASGLFGSVGLGARLPVWNGWNVYGEVETGSAVVGNLGVSHGW